MDREVFSVSAVKERYPDLRSRLIGSHQIVNAAVAIGAIEELKERGVNIPVDAIRSGIENAAWEGRLEVIGRNPLIVLDGAQNRDSARALAIAIRKAFKYKKLLLVFGASKDKDVRGMLEEMMPICDSIILTRSNVPNRALEPAKIETQMLSIKCGVKAAVLTDNTKEALSRALSMARPEDLVLIAGSLFIVGEVKDHYQKCVNTV